MSDFLTSTRSMGKGEGKVGSLLSVPHRSSRLALLVLMCAALAILLAFPGGSSAAVSSISFGKSTLAGQSSIQPTSLQFGPDGRLYVAQKNGTIKAYTIKRNGPNDYAVTATETISLVKNIANHNDDGSLNTSEANRQVTGIVVTGTTSNPVLYASSSDPRIGGKDAGTDTNLDTNSGIVSRLTWNGTSWVKLDLVRGLPRSEENHSVNGLQLSPDGTKLYLAVGGNTNQGAPSNNFAELPEFALSAAILAIDLQQIGNTTYDLPTLDDESRAGTSDEGDPFGGNDGKNQAKLVPNGPVQVYAPGFRNPYDLVIAESGKMYSIDNGGNAGWGDVPQNVNTPNCTNAAREPGSTNPDNWHYISGPGYYGGHPNPTRANTSNTFNATNPQSPVSASNPVECNYVKPASGVTTFPGSTNGIDEYTATNFGGAMKGNLLAADYSNNVIYRLQLDGTGTGLLANDSLFSNVGVAPLDVTAQGDSDVFPGTIWVADIFGGGPNIRVFEPADFGGGGGGTCDPSNPGGDADGDGFTNQDEVDNGTDPCSAADVPSDADGDNISNKNDPDDDNDGKPDTSDPFAVDPANGTSTDLPAVYNWDNTASYPDTLLNLGFTGLMTNGKDDYESLFDPTNMTAGGAAGAVTIDSVPAGDANSTKNTQKYGFQFGVDVGPNTGVYTAHTRILAPFAGITPQNYQSMGLFIGTGDQDNYVKLTTFAGGGTGAVQFGKEVATSFTSRKATVAMPGPSAVDLYLTVDPVANTVQPSYVVIDANGNAGPRNNVGAPVAIPAEWNSSANALAAGLISTSNGPGPEFAATWDLIEVVPGDGSAPPPPPERSTSAATVTISPPSTDILKASTYSQGSFKIKNTSLDGQKIKNLKLDLSTAIYPDLVLDPNGTAGDVSTKCLTPDNGATATGFSAPADLCTDPFSVPHGGNVDDGYDVVSMNFTDFNPGETFAFSVDVDPTTVKGMMSTGGASSVSGLELAGSTATVGFNDGAAHTARTFRIPNSVVGSQNTLKLGAPAEPGISVPGVTLATTTLSSQHRAATVSSAAQTVRVSGPANSKVSLVVLEGGLFNKPPGGFYDLEPFEANKALKVTEHTATIGAGGTVDIPVTLTDSAPADKPAQGGLNYIAAVIKDASGRTGPLSDVVVLDLDAAAQPSSALEVSPQSVNFGEVLVGETAYREVMITNDSGEDMSVNAEFSGPDASSFAGDRSGALLLPGDSQVLGAIFNPQSAGAKVAKMIIDRGGSNPPVEISLSGSGRRPVDTISPTVRSKSPASGSEVRDRTPTIRSNVKDNSTNLSKADMKLFLDGKAIPGRAFGYNRQTDWLSYGSKRLSLGTHRVRVVVTDGAGNRTAEVWRFKVIRG